MIKTLSYLSLIKSKTNLEGSMTGALQTGTPNGLYSDARTVRFEPFYKGYEIRGMRFQKDEFYFKWLEHSIGEIGKAA